MEWTWLERERKWQIESRCRLILLLLDLCGTRWLTAIIIIHWHCGHTHTYCPQAAFTHICLTPPPRQPLTLTHTHTHMWYNNEYECHGPLSALSSQLSSLIPFIFILTELPIPPLLLYQVWNMKSAVLQHRRFHSLSFLQPRHTSVWRETL